MVSLVTMARIPDPDLPIYKSLFHHTMVDKKYRKTNLTNDRKKNYLLYNFYWATITIRGTLLLNNSIVKRSVENKL